MSIPVRGSLLKRIGWPKPSPAAMKPLMPLVPLIKEPAMTEASRDDGEQNKCSGE